MSNDSAASAQTSASDSAPVQYTQILILTLATFMAALDSSVVNVSLPKMASDLSVTPNEMAWVIGAYLIATAAILPIAGWLATYLGRKRYYMISVVVFTVSSIFCGLATNLESLVFFRIIQGLSGGGLSACEQAIIADITPTAKLGKAFSVYAFAIVAAPVMGPTLGGFITDQLSWHWVFFINLPVGIVSLLLTGLFVHESPQAKKERAEFFRGGKTIDLVGIVLFVGGIALLELVLEKGPKEGWLDSTYIMLTALAAFFMLLIGVGWEYYQEKPAVDVMMFKNRGFAGAWIMGFVVSFNITGSSFLMPFMTQNLLGYTATQAGMMSLPATIVQMIGIQLVAYLMGKFDTRKIIFCGLAGSMLSVWYFTTFNLNVDFWTMAEARAFQNFSLSFLAITINTVAYYGLPPGKNNSASSLMNLSRTMGASMGVALTSTILALQTQVHINNFSYRTNNLNPNFVQSVKDITQNLEQHGYNSLQAAGSAYGVIWHNLLEQASMKAILDAYNTYLILYICILPLIFLLRRKPAEPAR